MKINLVIDSAQLTIDDMIWFDEHPSIESTKPHELKAIAARFVRAEDGSVLEEADAFNLAGKVTLEQLIKLVNTIKTGMEGLQQQAGSPTTGSESK